MKQLPEKITIFIHWDDHIVTIDVDEVLNELQDDEDLWAFFLEENHPEYEYNEKDYLPEEVFDEFRDYCLDEVQAGWDGWEVKKVDYPY